MGDSPVARRVEDAVSGAVRESGLLIEDVTVTPAGKRRVVRIAVDRDLGDVPVLDVAGQDASDDATRGGTTQQQIPPLDLDAVADATRAISAALDESDALGNAPYTLEVTSPGVSRPLTLPRHFRRNVGRLVTLALADGAPVTGRLLAAGSDALRLRVEDAKKAPQIMTFPLSEVRRGDVQVEFGRVDAPTDGDDSDEQED
ncbi:ribosome maturation factor RimP [Mobilicoccus massiliensis]|uniref:ribosome maturation factor RimP n=1 Tax=Mobilicoccus massiliensis TaxID=1522310 RepID=UPI00058E8CFB|nr:ribosome maturation factor RimP [Mobilicoccus massiliensis]